MVFKLNTTLPSKILVNEQRNYPVNLTKKQKNIVLLVAISTFFLLSIPALVIYFIFKAQALKNSSKKIQDLARKTELATQPQETFTNLNKPLTNNDLIFPNQTLQKTASVKLKQETLENPQISLLVGKNEKRSSLQELTENEKTVIKKLQVVVEKIKTELDILDEKNRRAIEIVLNELSSPGILNEDFPIDETGKEKVFILREKLKLAIQKAGVQRELRKKGKVVSALDFELPLLKALGYLIEDESNYHNKEYLYQIVSQVVESEINKLEITSLSDISNFFTKIGLKVRLQQVNLVDAKKIQKFETILSYCQKYRKKDWGRDNILLSIPEDVPQKKFPNTLKKLHENFEFFKKSILDTCLSVYITISDIKNVYTDPQYDLAALEALLNDENENQQLNKLINDNWKKASTCTLNIPAFEEQFQYYKNHFEFMRDFGPYLVYEMVQGDKPDEVLDGSCYALNLLLQKNALSAPDSDSKELKPKIDRKSRFIQSRYEVDPNHASKGFEKPQLLFKLYKTDNFENELNQEFEKIKEQLKISFGWVNTSFKFAKADFDKILSGYKNFKELSSAFDESKITRDQVQAGFENIGHAISMRRESATKKFELFDPNIGHFKFTKVPDGNRVLMAATSRLIKTLYPRVKYLEVNQMFLKKKMQALKLALQDSDC